tara:strand:+ start:38845 stop:39159 length:315 start_codon:yes stop_codon:yes gene_type:complete
MTSSQGNISPYMAEKRNFPKEANLLNKLEYANVPIMDNDFKTTDPILDDQRWWGTNASQNADEAARRYATSSAGTSRAVSRKNWIFIILGWMILAFLILQQAVS